MTIALPRKAMPVRVKLAVVIRQDSYCTGGCSSRLDPMNDGVVFDHNPPLSHRPLNDDGTDYDPPQNDPAYIDAICKHCDKRKTPGDISKAAKIERQRKKHTGETKPKGNIPSRKFSNNRDGEFTTKFKGTERRVK